MRLTPGLERAMSYVGARKVRLFTLNLFGADPYGPPHLALQPGSYCFATDRDVHVESARGTIPFWPWLADWPRVTRRFVPHERRAEISEISAEILSDSRLNPETLQRGGQNGVTVRVDHWTD